MMRALSVFLVIAVILCSSYNVLGDVGDCRQINKNLFLRGMCNQYFADNFMVPKDFNETAAEENAYQDSLVTKNRCPFYTMKSFECKSLIWGCDEKQPTNKTTIKMCKSSCLYGAKWENKFCGSFGDQYFQNECADSNGLYALSPPCSVWPEDSTDNSWKYILGGILGGVALIIIISYVVSRCKECYYKRQFEKEDVEEARREQEKRDNEMQQVSFDRPQHAKPGAHGTMVVLPSGDSSATPAASSAAPASTSEPRTSSSGGSGRKPRLVSADVTRTTGEGEGQSSEGHGNGEMVNIPLQADHEPVEAWRSGATVVAMPENIDQP